jgi:hypothetical protein
MALYFDRLSDQYDDCEPEFICYQCEERDKKIDEVRDFFSGVLDQLYTPGRYNSEIMEHCIEELCEYLDIKMPMGRCLTDAPPG